MSICLLDRLPALVDMKSILPQQINVIEGITKITLEALRAFQNRDFAKFDASIGDQACQIRAFKISLMDRNGVLHIPEAIDELEHLSREIEEELELLAEKTDRKAIAQARQALLDSLEAKCKTICLSSEIAFLTDAYLINKMTKITLKEGEELDYRQTLKLSSANVVASRNDLSKIYEIAKNALLHQSIEVMERDAGLKTGLRKIHKKEQSEFPCYFVIQSIFERVIKEDIPVILKVRSTKANPLLPESYRFKAAFTADGQEDFTLQNVDPEASAIIIECKSRRSEEQLKSAEFLPSLLREAGSLFSILRMNAAQHCQYSDQTDEIPGIAQHQKEEIAQFKEEAQEKGFSGSNPSICAIEHIFCDVVKNQLEADFYE